MRYVLFYIALMRLQFCTLKRLHCCFIAVLLIINFLPWFVRKCCTSFAQYRHNLPTALCGCAGLSVITTETQNHWLNFRRGFFHCTRKHAYCWAIGLTVHSGFMQQA